MADKGSMTGPTCPLGIRGGPGKPGDRLVVGLGRRRAVAAGNASLSGTSLHVGITAGPHSDRDWTDNRASISAVRRGHSRV